MSKKKAKRQKQRQGKKLKNKKILNSTLIRPELPKSCLEYRPVEKID